MNASDSMADAPVRILLVEDVPADAELTIDDLHDNGVDCDIRCVETEADYLEALKTFKPDIVLSDLNLPAFDGYRALNILRQHDVLLPFIFVSGTMGEEVAVEALHKGATDYILKSNTMRLASAVRRAVHEAEEQRARQRAEEELIRAQRFESLALLASGLSHDLRNLLQPLLLAADTLDDYTDDPRLTRLGDMVRGCGQRGLDMVSSMLSFARGAHRTEQVRVSALFQALDLLLKGSVPRNIQLHIDDIADDMVFEGNQTELQQCLLNLSLNAIQAMPDGGTLTVSAQRCKLSVDFFRSGEEVIPETCICLSVIDTGTGMSPDVVGHLFQPFFTTKKIGTGLGLVSCRRIMDSHGGVMRVHSEEGEGTHFQLYLPVAAEDDAEQNVGDVPRGQGERILVVEEEAAQLSLLSSMLDSSGYDTHASQSGAAALQSLDNDGLPQLVVMDADMTLLTGVRTLAALLERDYHGAVLLMARPDAPPDLNDLPPIEHLAMVNKPVKIDALLRATRKALDVVLSKQK